MQCILIKDIKEWVRFFQGPYKAAYIDNELQYLYLSKYIHRNPLDLPQFRQPAKLQEYPYSSYRNYLGFINQAWIHPSEIIDYFSKDNHHTPYQEFVEENNELSEEISTLKYLTLDFGT